MARARTALLLASLVLAPPAFAQAPAPLSVDVATPGGTPTTIGLDTLPAAEASLTLGNPPAPHTFRGLLLWTVLLAAHRVDPVRHADIVRQTVRLQGTDGYVAILAAAELSPDFADHPVLLATSMDGTPLPHPRAVVLGEHRLGRSVRDVALVTLDTMPKPSP